jgi:hypothetical protein
MSFSEYDRKILMDMTQALWEIKDILAETLDLSRTCFKFCVDRHNKNARLAQENLRNHLGLLEEANEED